MLGETPDIYLLRTMTVTLTSALLVVCRSWQRPFLILLLLAACWSTDSMAQGSSETTGTVYLLRRTGYSGSMDGYSVFMDGSRICLLNNKKYSVHQVPVGEHKFSVRFNGNNEKESTEQVVITVGAGKDYYITIDQRSGWTVKLTLQELAASSGKKAMEDLTRDDNCD